MADDNGFRMTEAEDDNGFPVTVDMIDQDPRPFVKPLKCRHCPRPVSAVRSHSKARPGGGPASWVHAHLRLNGYPDHGPQCPLNPLWAIEQIARGSEGLAIADPDGSLRLVLPDDSGPGQVPPTDVDPAEPPTDVLDDLTALRITTIRPVLPPALNSAVRIVQFLQLNAFAAPALRLFNVDYRGTRIAWRRFCYGPPAYTKLLQRVVNSGSALPHPVAVYGTVIRAGVAKRTGKAYAVLASQTPGANGQPPFDVLLYSLHPSLLAPLKPGMHVLAIGERWKYRTDRPEVQFWATAHWQLAYWATDQATGLPAEPACPPPLTASARPRAPQPRRPTPRAARPTTSSTPPTPAPQPEGSLAETAVPTPTVPAPAPETAGTADTPPDVPAPEPAVAPDPPVSPSTPKPAGPPPKPTDPPIPPPPLYPPHVRSDQPGSPGVRDWLRRFRKDS
ncbi:hypothetical protein [Streptomyces sp. RKAG293]|uniref:hypothetical protein n=1 Tax=Streptomyces sp. RKAG293 TaxID=2893403 RepID=UPI002034081F|nr:hypothetical protein [Streptomyces sp. RKAG293]MCM2424167.1 hypothetical protein [Streptomyces sp. RKAG293]